MRTLARQIGAMAWVLGAVLAALPAAGQTRTAVSSDLSTTLEETTRVVGPTVVEIFATSYVPGEGLVPSSADLVTTARASGSGVIIDAAGFIVTNAHVVRGARHVRVSLPTPDNGRSILIPRGRTVGAQVVGIDLETDLAVLKVNETGLPALPFGDSDNLRAGQIVLAFGSPLGLEHSVSLGVVSAVARQLEPESPMIYVQTDASINPGSSGGPLVNTQGQLVGINTLIVSRAGGNDGLGFAAPSNIVRTVYDHIRQYGRVRRGDIGARSQTLTPVLASGLGLDRGDGVILSDVTPGGPASRAGLRPGDLVLALDGKPMENGRQFQIGLYRHMVGDFVTLQVLREGKPFNATIVMRERQDVAGLSAIDPRDNLIPRLGVLGVELNQQIVDLLPVRRVTWGVVVASTVAGGLDASEGGLTPGDVIASVNRTPVRSILELRKTLDSMTIGAPVVLQIERKGELRYLAFTLE